MTRNGRIGSTPIRGTWQLKRLPFMFYTYILYSAKCDRYYIGYCADVQARLIRHNNGMVTATRNCRPYEVKAFKTFLTGFQIIGDGWFRLTGDHANPNWKMFLQYEE